MLNTKPKEIKKKIDQTKSQSKTINNSDNYQYLKKIRT